MVFLQYQTIASIPEYQTLFLSKLVFSEFCGIRILHEMPKLGQALLWTKGILWTSQGLNGKREFRCQFCKGNKSWSGFSSFYKINFCLEKWAATLSPLVMGMLFRGFPWWRWVWAPSCPQIPHPHQNSQTENICI